MWNLRQSLQRIAIGATAMISTLYGLGNRTRIGAAMLPFLLLVIMLVVGVATWRSSMAAPQNHPVVQFHGLEDVMRLPDYGQIDASAKPLGSELSTSSISVQSGGSAESDVRVQIDGEQITVPNGGSETIHRESVSDGNKTTVDISIQADGVSSGVSSSSSSLHLNVDSSQTSINNSE